MKKLLSLLLCVMLLFSITSITAFAAETAVAKIGDVEYATIAEAIAAVEDGGTIQLLAGEFDEVVETGRLDKSFTVIGADDYTTVLTGGMIIGTDNSSKPIIEQTVTVKGITFKNTCLSICDIRNAVVEDNVFENITATAAIQIIDSATDGNKSNAVIKNNIIDTVSSAGINIRNGYNITITDNTVKNTQHNAITVMHNAKYPANKGSLTVTDNTFENWALGGDGRVLRATFGSDYEEIAKEVTFTDNKMVRDTEPEEEYVKITEVGTVAVNLEKNYWNSDAPDFDTIVSITGTNTDVDIEEYYKAATMKDEDLNTYVAPVVDDKKDDTKTDNNKTDNTKTDNTQKDTVADIAKTDNTNTSPKTGDNLLPIVFTVISAVAIFALSTRKIKN